MLENEAAETLFAWLRARGRVIDEICWPDRERHGRKGQAASGTKTVDLTFHEDGRLVAVDILELYVSERDARQSAEMGRIGYELEQALRPQLRELNPQHTIAISWEIGWLPPSGSKVMRAGLDMVKATILAAAAGLHDGDDVELDPKPDFIPELRAICYASPTPKFGFISMGPEGAGYVGHTVEAMAESLLASSKPEQLRAFIDARVLAIDQVVMPFAEDLAAALKARVARIPANWTAIYFMPPWRPGSLSEVWSRASTSTPAQ